MKKSTKILAATLAVLPCALVLTACGGKNESLIDGYKEATYTETTYEEFTQEIETRGNGVLTGIKAKTSLSVNLTTDFSGLGSYPGMPALPTEPITETLKLDNTTVVSGLGVDTTAKLASNFSLKYNDEKYEADAYYTDATFFVDLSGLNLQETMGESYVEGLEKFSYNVGETTTYADVPGSETQFTLDLASLLAMLDETEYAELKDTILQMATWSSEKTDTTYKVKLSFDGEEISEFLGNLITSNTELSQLDMFEELTVTTFNVYFVYGETALDGIALDFEGTVKLNMSGIKYSADLKLNTEVVPTTEEAKLPKGLTIENYPALDTSIFDNLLPQE